MFIPSLLGTAETECPGVLIVISALPRNMPQACLVPYSRYRNRQGAMSRRLVAAQGNMGSRYGGDTETQELSFAILEGDQDQQAPGG